jgi:hypothetical protein
MIKSFTKSLVIFIIVCGLTACGDETTVEPTKETITTVIAETPEFEIIEMNSLGEVESTFHAFRFNIPKEGIQKIDLGFSRLPEVVNLIVNEESFPLNETGSIEIDLLEKDIVMLEIRQNVSDDLDMWLNGFSSNGRYYDTDTNIWKISFKYQKPELIFGIKPIATNVQQLVNSVTFHLNGENNLKNIYQADVFTLDGCYVGSGEAGKFGEGIVEVFFTEQCHDNLYFTDINEERNYLVRFLSITGEPTWNVLNEGISFVDIHYYDTSYRGSHHNRKTSVNRNFQQLYLKSPYFTVDSWTDTPAFIFDTIEIEVPVDGDYTIEFDSEACPEFECSGRKGQGFTSIDGKIVIDNLWVRYNTDLIITLYNSEPTRVNFEITDCNISDSNWEVFFTCPFKTK